MKTPLIEISILSIYRKNGVQVALPRRMARCTPDMCNAIQALRRELQSRAGNLYLSDLFRSYDMQLQAHLDWKSGKKPAYSPAPGGSMHEAGRAFDLDLGALGLPLADFWQIAGNEGITPIIAKPVASLSEAWHFDCRGSHDVVYDYYKGGDGNNFKSPYAAMSASAILATGERVDFFGAKQTEAAIQAGLIRLGFKLGNIDGNIGAKTKKALEQVQLAGGGLADTLEAVEGLLQQKYPAEYSIGQQIDAEADDDVTVPEHVLS